MMLFGFCFRCKFMNFSRNTRCLKCKANGPERVSVGDVEMKKGDWNCPKCEFMNFASNTKCLRCRGPRPKRELVPGDWECPKCDFVNYRRNMVCRKCDCERPKVAAAQYEDQLWRKPR
ncbi:zinc finger protein VAR3, chloroplastic-like [Cornus florida]|uniref:zinc finger protein VAR3, chloroplastic-like n=1 Tax=Cornus florida TaxID=4283 RepID=UPI002896A6A8|nr:zinc finger protein VAR3, chloroplastic-like [Cornus florida]